MSTHPAWKSDQGDGTYLNPILHLDYSDPDVIRVGGDFFMTASSFNCTPGLPILHSKDLVNWRLVNYAIKNLDLPGYDQPGMGAVFGHRPSIPCRVVLDLCRLAGRGHLHDHCRRPFR